MGLDEFGNTAIPGDVFVLSVVGGQRPLKAIDLEI